MLSISFGEIIFSLDVPRIKYIINDFKLTGKVHFSNDSLQSSRP